MEHTTPSRPASGAAARPRSRVSTGVAGRRSGGGRGGVGAIARAVGRSCSRPGCPTPAASTLVFSYADRTATLRGLLDDPDPQAYDLCEPHAGRTRPPHGWELADERPARPSGPPLDLDDEDGTVALLARALHGEPAPVDDGPDTGPGHDAAGAPAHDPDEDPLRAALEEVQRVVVADPSEDAGPPPAPPTPLRRRRVVIVDVDDPEAEPTLW